MKKYILLLFLFAFTLNTFSQKTNSESKKEENQISNVTEVGDTKTESADDVAAAKKQKNTRLGLFVMMFFIALIGAASRQQQQ